MYESPVAASLAESASISLPPALYLKQSGLLDQMRREILCEGASLVEADSTSASVRGNAMVTSSVNLMTQLYAQVDPSTSRRKGTGAATLRRVSAVVILNPQCHPDQPPLTAHLRLLCPCDLCPSPCQPTRIRFVRWRTAWRWTASQSARSTSPVSHTDAVNACQGAQSFRRVSDRLAA